MIEDKLIVVRENEQAIAWFVSADDAKSFVRGQPYWREPGLLIVPPEGTAIKWSQSHAASILEKLDD